MAGTAHPRGVPGAAPGGHGGALTGEYTDTETEGVYRCRACGAELFRSKEKFESHCGWPSFYQPSSDDAVVADRGQLARHDQDRGPVRPLRLPPRARVRG